MVKNANAMRARARAAAQAAQAKAQAQADAHAHKKPRSSALTKADKGKKEPIEHFSCIIMTKDRKAEPSSSMVAESKKRDTFSALTKADKAKKEVIANELISLLGYHDNALGVSEIRNCVGSGIPMFTSEDSKIRDGKPVVIRYLLGRSSPNHLLKVPLESSSEVRAFVTKHWP